MENPDHSKAVDYSHGRNLHTAEGPEAAMRALLPELDVTSILDVGCGTGTWLRAARQLGVTDVVGIDGVNVPEGSLLIPREQFRHQDLTQAWDLGRRFGAVFCLEVAEHLDERYAGGLVANLVRHADLVLFSAACPGQAGQHHVHCRWPEYWQGLFNQHGFSCSDRLRWKIWGDARIEPWYRQNLLVARKDPDQAGREPRILPVLHPDLLPYFMGARMEAVEAGELPVTWYLTVPFRAVAGKLGRRVGRGS